MTRLQKINMDYGAHGRPGWATRTLHAAGVPFDAIFEPLDELFQSKVCTQSVAFCDCSSLTSL